MSSSPPPISAADDVRGAVESISTPELNAFAAEIGRHLTEARGLPEMLGRCTQSIVDHLHAAFARIWTLNEAGDVLELRASSGMYTHLDGAHGRVPVGMFKIGLIASERLPHLTNEVQGDPRVPEQAWAREHGLVAFAGYPLIVDERLVGVMAMFSRRRLSERTLDAMGSMARHIALGIERKHAEDSLREARDAAEAANRAKDEFLATLSHELRTPLNAILGWTQILRLDGPTEAETWAEGLDVIERNTRSQVQLIEDILDVSRIIAGKLRLNVRPVSPGPVLNGALDAVRPAAKSRSIRLECVIDPHAGPIAGDPDRLQQVFWNLLSNAIKFTPKGGKVQVSLARVNSSVEVTVADTGEGIAAEFLPHVFERFQQADSSSTRTHKGLGLGLAIVRHLVELHGGGVRVESAGLGKGATFHVSLPLAIAHTRQPTWPAAGSLLREHPTAEDIGRRGSLTDLPRTLAGISIVAVDDDAEARVLLQRILSYCQADVTVVGTAAEALRAVELLRPDVLLSDIEMPGEDGYTLIARVRALGADRGGDTPAAALTAYARAEDRTRALLAGFQLHVPKPVEPTELVAVVTNLAGRTKAPGRKDTTPG